MVKGIQTLEDAKAVVDLGVDGILLSNHGGRQLDRAPVPFHLLPRVAAELGRDTEVLLDTGIMSGADVVAAIALGARFTLVGRAYLYGLMAGGEAGVDRAIEILSGQVSRTMRLLGVTSLDELTPRHVTQLHRFAARRVVAAQIHSSHIIPTGHTINPLFLSPRRVGIVSQPRYRSRVLSSRTRLGHVFHYAGRATANALWHAMKGGLVAVMKFIERFRE